MRYIIICISTLSMLTACSTRIADLTVISPSNVSLVKADIDSLPQVKNIEGVDKKTVVLVFPLGQPNLEEAVSDALRKGDGDLMTDITVYEEGWSVGLFGQTSIRVQGTVVKTRGR